MSRPGPILLGERHQCQCCNCCCVLKYPTTMAADFLFKSGDGSSSGFSVGLTNKIFECAAATPPAPVLPPATPPCDHCVEITDPCGWYWAVRQTPAGPPVCGYTRGATCGDLSFVIKVLTDPGPPPVWTAVTYYVTRVSLRCVCSADPERWPGTCLRFFPPPPAAPIVACGWLAEVAGYCSCDVFNGLPDPCDPITAPPFSKFYNSVEPSGAIVSPCDYLHYKCCPGFQIGFWDRIWDFPNGDPYPSAADGSYIQARFTGAPLCYPRDS